MTEKNKYEKNETNNNIFESNILKVSNTWSFNISSV